MYNQNDKTTPHRFDVVGSFLRPEKLKQACIQFEKGQIDSYELKLSRGQSYYRVYPKGETGAVSSLTVSI